MLDTENDIYLSVPDKTLWPSLKRGLASFGLDQVHIIASPPDNDNAIVYELKSENSFGTLLDRLLSSAEDEAKLDNIAIGPYCLSSAHKELLRQEDNPVSLTDIEFKILSVLASLDGQSIGRQDLLEQVWGYNEDIETHTLETHIYRLRQKIEVDPARPEILCTSKEGYFLAKN